MSSINFASKEISVKIVYYGPGLCGKTTSLHHVYNNILPDNRPKMVSLATDVDRTIFFDFLPVTAYKVRDFLMRLQLYTVPGQVFYNSTRKLVLNGADGVVFVADSQRQARDSNLESYRNLEENLLEQGVKLASLPHIFQFNKQDLADIMSPEELDQELNRYSVPTFVTVATNGKGVLDVLKEISKLVINDLNRKGLGRRLNQEPAASGRPTAVVWTSAGQESLHAVLGGSGPADEGAYEASVSPDAPASQALSNAPASQALSNAPVSQALSNAPATQASSAIKDRPPAVLEAIWRTPRQRELAHNAEVLIKDLDLNGLRKALAELLEEAVRHGLPGVTQAWDSTRCALYKGLPGHLWTDIQTVLTLSGPEGPAPDLRTLMLIYTYAALAVDGWGTLRGAR